MRRKMLKLGASSLLAFPALALATFAVSVILNAKEATIFARHAKFVLELTLTQS